MEGGMRRERISQCVSVSESSVCPVKEEGKEGGREGVCAMGSNLESDPHVHKPLHI